MQKILKLATELSEAADNEDWNRLASVLAALNKHSVEMRYFPADKHTLISTLEKLNAAIQSSTRRKDEIGNLIEKLSDSPV